VLASFVVPLAFVGGSRGARAGQARAAVPLVVEHDRGLGAPPFLANVAGGPLAGGLGTAVAGPGFRSTDAGSLPARLVLAIVAANRISRLPYVWGGGHGSFEAAGYDCSGSVSYVLHAALALATPEDSTGLESYGAAGPGQWISVYANASHAFMTLGGLRYDTIGLSATGSRWEPPGAIPAGYVERHPIGL
jgi:cell wall-associated NlpC family hydrolase